MRALYHIGFWLIFTLVFVFQNPDRNAADYFSWFWILFVAAGVSYTNIFYLLPRFFFTKRYGLYVLLLLPLISAGSFVLKLGIFSNIKALDSSFFQGFINLFFFVVITSSFEFFREYRQKQALLIKVENEQLKTELKLLKAQVNPHFLFNTLSNLYGLILQDQNQRAAEVTLKLADLMRYLLQSSKTEKVPLAEEVKFIEDYLALEKIRLAQKADIQFITSGLDSNVQVAPMLFISFVENAFKHGLQSLKKESYAHFTLAHQGNELYFEAKNSLGDPVAGQQRGTGLKNLQKRLELNYPNKHILEIAQNDQYFKASLQITL